jgi:hypothetical protein
MTAPDVITEAEIMDLIDTMALTRYQVDGVEFLTYVSEGTAEDKFPGCHDMVILAQVLDP